MSFGGSGIRDWRIQRFTALYLGIYIIVCFSFAVTQSEINFSNWRAFFMHPLVKISTLIALLSLVSHAWIGLWIVLTDYVHTVSIRYFLQMMIFVSLLAYFIWGIQILYSFF